MKQLQAVTDGVTVRLGSLLSAALLGYGMQAEHVNLLVPALMVIAGVGFDMAVGAYVKRRGR